MIYFMYREISLKNEDSIHEGKKNQSLTNQNSIYEEIKQSLTNQKSIHEEIKKTNP